MTISMYAAAIPVMSRTLNNLAAILEKGAAHAEARKIDPLVLCGSRLYPDMFPLTKQVQIAADVAKGGAARLRGQEPPRFEDTEADFPELVARINKTVAYLATFKPGQIDGSENKTVTLKMRNETMTLPACPTCSISFCRTFTFTSRLRMTFCATTASKSANRIFWASLEGGGLVGGGGFSGKNCV